MSVATEITRLQDLRSDLRTKLLALGIISDSSAALDDCVEAVDDLTNNAIDPTPVWEDATMSKLVELYAKEVTKDDATITIADVPVRLRAEVQAAVEALR